MSTDNLPDPGPDETDDWDPDTLECTWCGGEGFEYGDEMGDPLRYDPDKAYPCRSCRGSGLRKDMTLW